MYCLPGAFACQFHRRAVKPRESTINGFVETLAQADAAVARALVAAIWGRSELATIEDHHDVSRLRLTEGGSGADWALSSENGAVLRVAEHKPKGAPAHWPFADHRSFDENLIERIDGDDWIETITPGCSLPHSADEFDCVHPWHYKRADRLSAPQPLAYLARARREHGVQTLTVVTDARRAATTVNDIWDTAGGTNCVEVRWRDYVGWTVTPARPAV